MTHEFVQRLASGGGNGAMQRHGASCWELMLGAYLTLFSSEFAFSVLSKSEFWNSSSAFSSAFALFSWMPLAGFGKLGPSGRSKDSMPAAIASAAHASGSPRDH